MRQKIFGWGIADFSLENLVVSTPEQQIRLVFHGSIDCFHDDPQGKHLRFAEVADANMAPFDFGNLSDAQLK